MEGYLHLLRNSGPAQPRPSTHVHMATTGRLLPASALPPASSPRAASLPRPTLTSEPLGVVLGGAERRLRPKASVHDSVAGLEIRSCGRVQAALWRGGWPGSGEAQGPASWPRLNPPLRSTGLGGHKLRGGLRGAPSSRRPALTCPGAHLRRRPRWTARCQRGIEPARSAPRPPAAAMISGGRGSRSWNPWGLGESGSIAHFLSPCLLPHSFWTPTLWAFPLLRSHGSVPTHQTHCTPGPSPLPSGPAPAPPSHPIAAAHGAE